MDTTASPPLSRSPRAATSAGSTKPLPPLQPGALSSSQSRQGAARCLHRPRQVCLTPASSRRCKPRFAGTASAAMSHPPRCVHVTSAFTLCPGLLFAGPLHCRKPSYWPASEASSTYYASAVSVDPPKSVCNRRHGRRTCSLKCFVARHHPMDVRAARRSPPYYYIYPEDPLAKLVWGFENAKGRVHVKM